MPMQRSSALALLALSSIFYALPGLAQSSVTFYVNPTTGSDRTGTGAVQTPFRTITKAIDSVPGNAIAVVQLSKGTYSVASGEIFPIRLPKSLVLRGDERTQGSKVVISGGGDFTARDLSKQNIAILGSDRSELRGVTIINRHLRGHGLWLDSVSPVIVNNTFTGNAQGGVFVTGSSAALLTNNTFSQNVMSGITIEGNASPTLRGNLIQGSSLGMDLRQSAAPQLADNTISSNQDGVLVQANARPWFRNNRIENNRQNGMIVLGDALPNLGATGDRGNNIFRNNQQSDLQALGANQVAIAGNQISKPTGKIAAANLNVAVQPSAPIQTATLPKLPLLPKIKNSAPLPDIFSVQPLASNNQSLGSDRQELANSAVIRISPKNSDQPPTPPSQIDQNLPPIALKPPSGAIVNQPIVLAPKAEIRNKLTAKPLVSPRFRVVVPSVTEDSISEIRRTFPQAFPSRQGQRLVVQVGAYGDRALADLQVQNLLRAGFTALIEMLP